MSDHHPSLDLHSHSEDGEPSSTNPRPKVQKKLQWSTTGESEHFKSGSDVVTPDSAEEMMTMGMIISSEPSAGLTDNDDNTDEDNNAPEDPENSNNVSPVVVTITPSPTSIQMASLRDTVDALSDRLSVLVQDIQHTSKDDGDDDDDDDDDGDHQSNWIEPQQQQQQQQPLSASALSIHTGNLVLSPPASLSLSLSITPPSLPPPLPADKDDISLDAVSSGQQGSKHDDDDDDKEEATLPVKRMVGFEALPPSPQRSQQRAQSKEPWEMPRTTITAFPHLPDLTATGAASNNKKPPPLDNKTANEDDFLESSTTSPARRLIRLIVCSVVALVVLLSIILIPDRQPPLEQVTTGPGAVVVVITPAPTMMTTKIVVAPSTVPTLRPSATIVSRTTTAPTTITAANPARLRS